MKSEYVIPIILLFLVGAMASTCGDDKVSGTEECELPGTQNNEYCQQTTEQCGGGTTGKKVMYRDAYGDCSENCGCVEDEWSTPVCEVGKCGAECDSSHDCNNKCINEVRYYDGYCGWSWSCECEGYKTENCTAKNNWYETGETRWTDVECVEKEERKLEYRTYSCHPSACEYEVTRTKWEETGNTQPKEQGALCGEQKDCPQDSCNGFIAEFYPSDGHDYCDGQGNCIEYSCEIEDSYCSDNDPNDGINGLTCGAECDQDSDCEDNDPTTTDQCNSCVCKHIANDADGDGVPDEEDNCPNTANQKQEDMDNDGIGDACDQDKDGDGVNNTEDAFPEDPTETSDNDEDGMGDNYDVDDDNDGVNDTEDNCPYFYNPAQEDFDGDGLGNECDDDMDGDGTPNEEDEDDDNDGVNDTKDNCPLIPNGGQEDMDNDSIGDVCDQDKDGDGINNTEDAFPENPEEQNDSDEDGAGDNSDNCPLTANPDQNDTDEDGIGNACDEDKDGDDLNNTIDNCPSAYNPSQNDTDEDGIGDECDKDIDNDNITNINDNCPYKANPEQKDKDKDGIGNACDDKVNNYCGDGKCSSGENCDNCNDCECDSGYTCDDGECVKKSSGGGGSGGVYFYTNTNTWAPSDNEEEENQPEKNTTEETPKENITCYHCNGQIRVGKVLEGNTCPANWTTEKLPCWELVDNMPPTKTGVNPPVNSILNQKTIPIEFNLSEKGNCKWSETRQDYENMTNNCQVNGTKAICTVELEEGKNEYYITCEDKQGNKDKQRNALHVQYELQTEQPPQPPEQTNPLTGLIALSSTSLPILLFAIIVIAVLSFYLTKKKKKKPRIRL